LLRYSVDGVRAFEIACLARRPSMIRTLCVAIAVVVAGCGSSGPQKTDGGTKMDGKQMDAPVDAYVGMFDFGCGGGPDCPLNQVCCTHPGPPLSFSCVAPASCPTADQIICDGPDECGGSTPVCCGVNTPDGTGSFPNCGVTSIGDSCTSAA